MTGRDRSGSVRAVLRLLSFVVLVTCAAGAWAQAPAEAPAAAPAAAAPATAPLPAAGSGETAPAVAVAEPKPTMEPELPRSPPPDLAAEDLDVGWALLRTVVVLGIVVMLAWLTLNVGLRKLLGIRPTVGTQLISVLERVPLDQKRALFVVEAAGEVLLVGGGDAGLSLLAKLDKAEVDRLRAATSSGGAVKLSPLVQKLLGRKDVPPPPAT